MSVTLNHTIVRAMDAIAAASFLTEPLGLPPAKRPGHFTIVRVGDTSLDLLETDEPVSSRHFAFLVAEAEFAACQI